MSRTKAFYTDSNGNDVIAEISYKVKKSGDGFAITILGHETENVIFSKTLKSKSRYQANKIAQHLVDEVVCHLEGIGKQKYVLCAVIRQGGNEMICPISLTQFHCANDLKASILDYLQCNARKELEISRGNIRISILKEEAFKGTLEVNESINTLLDDVIWY